MPNDDKSIVKKTELIYDELLDLRRRRPWLCIVVIVLIIAPYVFGLFQYFVTNAGLNKEVIQGRTELASARNELQRETAKVHELEQELTPFRVIAIEKFNKADADTLKSLACTMTALQHDYLEGIAKIASQQAQIDSLRARPFSTRVFPQ